MRLLSSLLSSSPFQSLSLSLRLSSSGVSRRHPTRSLQTHLTRTLSSSSSSSSSIVSPTFQKQTQTQTQQGRQQQQQTMTMSSNTSNTTTATTGITSSHYESHSKAESYEDAYFYEPGAYMERLESLVRDRLKMNMHRDTDTDDNETGFRRRCIIDIGGGTGNFAQALVQNDDRNRIVVVDPFLDPITTATSDISTSADDNNDAVSFIKASAEDFLLPPSQSSSSTDDWRTNIIDRNYDGYDQLLLKEVVHHFDKADRVGIFRGMREGLRLRSSRQQKEGTSETSETSETSAAAASINIPSILIVTRPQTDIDYPLWDDAREVWKQHQPSIESLEDELRTAGYTKLERTMESYPCSISLERWQSMVRTRFWSTFSNFSDHALEQACAIIAADHADSAPKKLDDDDDDDEAILHFEDRLIFLTAS